MPTYRPHPDDMGRVRDAYADRALEYSADFGSIEPAAEQDRQLIAAWSGSIDGRIIDVGCGPGQSKNYLRELGADVEGIRGILAWFSLIRSHPAQVGEIFAEFARCPRPNDGVLVGFCEGPTLEPFDHAVTTACFWPVDELTDVIDEGGSMWWRLTSEPIPACDPRAPSSRCADLHRVEPLARTR